MSKAIDDSLKTAVKGTTLVFAGTVASTLIWFASKVLLVRNTTKEELGIYTLALTVSGIASAVATVGLPEGITRFVSVFLAEGRKKDAEEISNASLQMGWAFGTVAALALFALSWPLSEYFFYKPELARPLRVISLYIVFNNMTQMLIGVLRGYGDIRPKVYFVYLGQPVFFLAFLGASILLGLPFIYIVYSFVFAVFSSAVLTAAYGYVKARIKPVVFSCVRFKKELFVFSFPLIGALLANMVFVWTDTFMLGRYTEAANVGVYNVSVSMARIIEFPLAALMFVFTPIAGELLGGNRKAELARVYQVLTKWVFTATLPVFFVLFLFPEMTITFLFGERFVESAAPLQLLCAGLLAHVFLGARDVLMIALGMTRVIFRLHLGGAVLNVLLNYVFIKRLGMGVQGAAAATMVSYIAVSLAGYAILRRETGVNPLTPGYLRPLMGSSAAGLAIYVVAKSIPLYYWMMPVYLLLFLGGYVASLLLSRSIEKEDIALLDAAAKRTGLDLGFLRRVFVRFSRG